MLWIVKDHLYQESNLHSVETRIPHNINKAIYPLLALAMPVVQTITTRYLDKAKLHNLLQTLFPEGGYECEVGIIRFLPQLERIDLVF